MIWKLHLQANLHSRKLTWIDKIMVWKSNSLENVAIFGSYVRFLGCNQKLKHRCFFFTMCSLSMLSTHLLTGNLCFFPLTHRIHDCLAYLSIHTWLMFMVNVLKSSSPMDPILGNGTCLLLDFRFKPRNDGKLGKCEFSTTQDASSSRIFLFL